MSDKRHNAGEDPLCNRRHFIFTNAGCYFSFPALDDVVFVGDAGVTVTDDISRALALLLSGWRLVSLCLRYCMGWQNWSLR
ncbi:hypothetical protein LKA24_003930 [Escherichia coli]|nr:hypothetical protein [Escherichia coli]